MNKPDIAKIIAIFLLIATVSGSVIFLLTSQGNEGSTENQIGMNGYSFKNQSLPEPNNAFVQPQENTNPVIPTAIPTQSTSSQDSDNLTEKLVQALGRQIARSNPNGPVIENGIKGLYPPDQNKLMADLAEEIREVKIPDWESEIVFGGGLKIGTSDSPQDFQKYQAQIQRIVGLYLAPMGDQPEFTEVVPTGHVASPISIALAETKEVVSPEPLSSAHWSLIKLLAYEDKAIQTARTLDADPVKASVILNAQRENYNAAATQYGIEVQKAARFAAVFESAGHKTLADHIREVIGIPTAHAIGWLNVDIPQKALQVIDMILKVALEKLKDSLVHRLVDQTIRWVQGGGKPQFITNWKGFMQDTAANAVNKGISQVAPYLCQSFGPLLRVAFTPVQPSEEKPPACTVDNVIANVSAFADSFENGSWIAYGATLQPSNNFWGSFIQTQNYLLTTAQAERKAKEKEVRAGKGFKPQTECVTWGEGSKEDEKNCKEWRSTTPGKVMSSITGDAFMAPLLRIVNAQDMAALMSALIDAALSKLTQMAKSSISKGLLGLDSKEPEIKNPCEGLSGDELAACQKNLPPEITPINSSSTQGSGDCVDGASKFQGRVVNAINSFLGGNSSIANPDDGCRPNFRIISGQENSYVQGVAAALTSGGLKAHQDPNAGDEIEVKEGESCSESFDILTSSMCANAKYMGTTIPATSF